MVTPSVISSNKKYIVTIRKRKISYFILNISVTLLVCRSIALNKCIISGIAKTSVYVRVATFRVTRLR